MPTHLTHPPNHPPNRSRTTPAAVPRRPPPAASSPGRRWPAASQLVRWICAALLLAGGLVVGDPTLGSGRDGTVGAAHADEPRWRWPLDPPREVVRRFQPPSTPYGPGHRGVDIAAAAGAVVRAAGAGRIGYAGSLAGRGVVTVQHDNGLRTTYEPVTPSVSEGMVVAAGDPIGTLEPGHLGCPAAACLHWGLRRDDVYLDPLTLLRSGPIRLLPRFVGPASEVGADSTGSGTQAGADSDRADRGQPAVLSHGPDTGGLLVTATLGLGAAAWWFAGRRGTRL